MASPDSDRRGSSSERGYGYKWQQARDSFLREHPFCSMCSTDQRPVAATVVDHKVAPKLKEAKDSGDPAAINLAWKLFWRRSNWQSLCKFCHDSTKQRAEKSGRLPGCAADGRPLDPGHHWNR
ncbi:HNH endonuclease signature motif containing protein [Pseudomonas protegens]|uniref:HNH endonuclease signature motif containing protein n=1 Tax=Pseudomonas protegens TaxID=380021 RepID=UPI002281ECE9|nr:HNH endonuclease signature motif containing protein [Pseudomonas protegens]MCY7262736.1 HNH endonuclease [Pseudomonas protegens]